MASSMGGAAALTAGEMCNHLQTLLDSKEQQLEQVGSLGQHILAQQMELEERVQELQALVIDQAENERLDHWAREGYDKLLDVVEAWDRENAQLSSVFRTGTSSSSQPIDTPSNDTSHILPQQEFGYPGTSNAPPTPARRAQTPTDDVEFAFEVGSGLLNEVRRLQGLLGVRDKALQAMKDEKIGLQKSVRALEMALALEQQEVSPHLREENWNLEVTVQELRSQLVDSKVALAYFESEHTRLAEALSAAHARDADRKHHQEGQKLGSSSLRTTEETVKPEEKTATTAGGGRWLGWFGSSSTSVQPPQAQVIAPTAGNDILVDEDDEADARSVISVKSELDAEDFVAVEKVVP